MLTNLGEEGFNDLPNLKQYSHPKSLLSTCDVLYSTSFLNSNHLELHFVFRYYVSFSCDEAFKENIYVVCGTV